MARYEPAVVNADLASLRSPSRLRLRRRHAPGPLRALSARRRARGDAGMVCMVVIAAAVAAGLFVVPFAMRETPATVASKPATANLVTDRPSEPAAIVKRIGPAPIPPIQAQNAAAKDVPAASPANASAAPHDTSMFSVDRLPVLEAEADFEFDQLTGAVAAAPARTAPKPVRRASTSEQVLRLPQP